MDNFFMEEPQLADGARAPIAGHAAAAAAAAAAGATPAQEAAALATAAAAAQAPTVVTTRRGRRATPPAPAAPAARGGRAIDLVHRAIRHRDPDGLRSAAAVWVSAQSRRDRKAAALWNLFREIRNEGADDLLPAAWWVLDLFVAAVPLGEVFTDFRLLSLCKMGTDLDHKIALRAFRTRASPAMGDASLWPTKKRHKTLTEEQTRKILGDNVAVFCQVCRDRHAEVARWFYHMMDDMHREAVPEDVLSLYKTLQQRADAPAPSASPTARRQAEEAGAAGGVPVVLCTPAPPIAAPAPGRVVLYVPPPGPAAAAAGEAGAAAEQDLVDEEDGEGLPDSACWARGLGLDQPAILPPLEGEPPAPRDAAVMAPAPVEAPSGTPRSGAVAVELEVSPPVRLPESLDRDLNLSPAASAASTATPTLTFQEPLSWLADGIADIPAAAGEAEPLLRLPGEDDADDADDADDEVVEVAGVGLAEPAPAKRGKRDGDDDDDGDEAVAAAGSLLQDILMPEPPPATRGPSTAAAAAEAVAVIKAALLHTAAADGRARARGRKRGRQEAGVTAARRG